MDEKHLAHVPTWILVLATINKLHDLRKGYIQDRTLATRKHIQQVLKEIYHRDLSTRQLDNILERLEKQDLTFKKRGLLTKKHVLVYAIKPHKIFHEAFTLIKLDSDSAYVLNGYEGIVYDPPSLETLFAETNGWFPEYWDMELIKNLEKALWTWAMGAEIVVRELARLEGSSVGGQPL